MTRLQPFFNSIELVTGNLHLAEIQAITKKELNKKSGIYGFLCKSNNNLYLGSSIDLSCRFNEHIKGSRSNILLQRAINKYKIQDFIFLIFEYCETGILVSQEQFFIDELKPEYNILKIAGSSLGYKHTEESKTLMSKIQNSIDKTGGNNPMFGKTHSAETRAKMSESRKGKTHLAETIAKISATQGTAIFVFDSVGTLINSFTSARKAAIYFECSQSTILKYAQNGKKFQGNWILSISLVTKEK
jgi:group I intron endonuclease